MSFDVALLIAVLMLLGNAFFVGAEFGLVSARRSSIELRALSGAKAAKITLGAMEHVSVMLAGAQLGVTLCSLILGAVSEPLLAHVLSRPFELLGMQAALLHITSLILALTIMTYLHVVIGEMVPKNLALADPDRAALLLVPPLAFLVRISRPVVTGLNSLANRTLLAIGIQPQAEIASTFTRDEVAGFVKESQREGLINKGEEQLLSGALRFDERRISSVVMPMDKVVSVTSQSTPAEVELLAAKTGFSRFPVCNTRGRFTGYIHLKDILGIPEDELNAPLPKNVLRPLVELKTGDTLRHALATMKRSKAHLAIAVGRGKQTKGLVALEDVLEELVGEITDGTQKATQPQTNPANPVILPSTDR